MRYVLLGLALLLGACTYLNPNTALEVQEMSPLDADPANLAVALALPQGVTLVPGSARLSLTARRSDIGDAVAADVSLARLMSGRYIVLAIAPADLARFRTAQVTARDWEASFPDATDGALSVTAEFCRTQPKLDRSAQVSVLIRTRAAAPFGPLLTDVPLRVIMRRANLPTLDPCQSDPT